MLVLLQQQIFLVFFDPNDMTEFTQGIVKAVKSKIDDKPITKYKLLFLDKSAFKFFFGCIYISEFSLLN